MRLIWLAVVPAWLAGCGFSGPCDHTRGITLYATSNGNDVEPVGSSTALSLVSFREYQNDGHREVGWAILSPPLRGAVTQVTLLEGSAAAGGGTLLYTFPIQNARALSDTITQVTSGMALGYGDADPSGWYRGTVPLADLMQRMYQSQTYLEVQTDSVPTGEFRAQLGTPLFFYAPLDPAQWQALYCG